MAEDILIVDDEDDIPPLEGLTRPDANRSMAQPVPTGSDTEPSSQAGITTTEEQQTLQSSSSPPSSHVKQE